MKYPLIGIYGGTFNPIHHGHLRMAQEIAEQLDLQEVKFIPSANPPHKPMPLVSAQQRAEMVSLAIADNPLFSLDKIELDRKAASYTIDTLKSLHQAHQSQALCLMMGSDAFLKFDTWHQWQEIIQYCHIVLVQRPNSGHKEGLNKSLSDFMQQHYTEDSQQLCEYKNGLICMQVITALDVSSSQIRRLIQSHKSAGFLTPKSVVEYINHHGLYV